MHVIITGIHRGARPVDYTVDMLIDGESKSFEFSVSLPRLISVSFDDQYEAIFSGTRGARPIAKAVIDFHKGNPIEFPLDIGEVIDLKPFLRED